MKFYSMMAAGLVLVLAVGCAAEGSAPEGQSVAQATSAPAAPKPALQMLTGEEIRKVVSGTTQRGTAANGTRYAVYRAADGAQKLTWSNAGRTGKDTGVWRLDGDRLCTKWQQSNSGQETCDQIAKEGNGYVTIRGSTHLPPFTAEPGDTSDRL